MHLRDVLPEFVYPEWVKITLVCRSWRNTVISCPNLWTYIPEYSDSTPRWIATHFERAGPSVPLHIHWDGRGRQEEHTSPLIGFIPTNLHRIQTLKLTDIGGDPGDPRLRTLSSGHAPLLQSLSISCYGLPVLPDEILSGGTPKLQKLVLRSCLVKPTASLLRNITLFELQCFPDDNENGPRIQDILKQMPQLTHLRLQLTGGAKLLESQSAQLEDAVPVPSVTNVTCEADFETCRALFEAVAFPPSAMVLVYCFLRSEQSPHLLSASGFRPQWILPHQDPDKPQTLIFRSSSYRTMLVLWCDFTRLRTGAPTVDEEPVGGVFIIFKIGHWRMKLHEASRILRAQSLGSIRCMEFVWTWNETEATCAYLIDLPALLLPDPPYTQDDEIVENGVFAKRR
ncbi:hypothetical protein CC1G_14795 [Coprinopsis cinerea okayama7|uniref:F-box domain-containing protein n=1 Tax=Coprinopsis cinerea (strain Okayama-7 / 130 / ATCC MYA-4618 / FGSC 9003) TaxID=240176 RepID=D6RNH6_COPC7|nr:hypothetical protein CC1G_14795 [Coprinopsis cinerea okayama7\|eukprot:XP_002910817.1 hypothetical protein CC1G_14795 [Coprinopsis cinerea okayama7\